MTTTAKAIQDLQKTIIEHVDKKFDIVNVKIDDNTKELSTYNTRLSVVESEMSGKVVMDDVTQRISTMVDKAIGGHEKLTEVAKQYHNWGVIVKVAGYIILAGLAIGAGIIKSLS